MLRFTVLLLAATVFCGPVLAQTAATEFPGNGQFLGRYVAGITTTARNTPEMDEVKVTAPQLRPAQDLLLEISEELDATLELHLWGVLISSPAE
jgi:hypothetical protein